MLNPTHILKNKSVVANEWTLLPLVEVAEAVQTTEVKEGEVPVEVGLDLDSLQGQVIYPLSVWQKNQRAILSRGEKIGVWLDAHESAHLLATDLPCLSLIAVNFPKYSDGRGFTSARLLRERYGFAGEIRAIGDVLLDQLYFLQRCGVDAFALRADQNVDKCIESLVKSEAFASYQGAVDQKLPHFRRESSVGESV